MLQETEATALDENADRGAGSKDAGKRSWEDILVYILAGALLITLGFATAYGVRYGNVDTSVTVGDITIAKNGEELISVHIDADMNATVAYKEDTLTGKMTLAGAETDTVLLQLKQIEYADGSDPKGAVFFIRMPRTGVQGDFAGPWMTYYSRPSANTNLSDWIIAQEDGTALVGWEFNMNAITAQRKQLIASADDAWTWKKDGSVLQLESAR